MSSTAGLFDATRLAEAARRAGVKLLSFEELDEMAPEARNKYLREIYKLETEYGIDLHESLLESYRDWRRRCSFIVDEVTGRRCDKPRWDLYPSCLRHVSAADLDSRTPTERRAEEAKVRLAELLERGVDQLEEIINAPADKIAPSTRLKAVEMLFDRSGLPRRSAADLEVRGEITHTTDAAAVVASRLDHLAEQLTAATQQEADEILDADVISDSAGSSDGTEEGAA